MPLQKLSGLLPSQIRGKTILMRVDFNVPIKDGKITEDSRIRKAVPTISHLLEHGAGVVLMSHLGRPKGRVVEHLRLDAVAQRLGEILARPVQKMNDCIGTEVMEAKKTLQPGEVMVLENTRFYRPETENLRPFAGELAQGCDLFVQEAFGTIHRAHASTEGVAHFLPSVQGLLVEKEVEMLNKTFDQPQHPLTVIVGGAKINTKIGIIHNFLSVADTILIGGGLANTFLHAKGLPVGGSLCQKDKVEVARQILMEAGEQKCRIVLPSDVVVSDEIARDAQTQNVVVDDVDNEHKILDIGKNTAREFAQIIRDSQMIIWNGPMGIFEYPPFAGGTKTVTEAVRDSGAVSLLGGGDTVDALREFGIGEENFTHVSTGGGAMLEFLEGKILPGLAVLKSQPNI